MKTQQEYPCLGCSIIDCECTDEQREFTERRSVERRIGPQTLAMYIGCQASVITRQGPKIGVLSMVMMSNSPHGWLVGVTIDDDTHHKSCGEIKPILRPLYSMTEEEAAQVGEIVFGKHDSVKWRSRAERNEKGDIKYYTVYRKYYELFLTIDVPTGEVECYRENKESPGLDDKEIYNNQHKVTAYLLSKSFDLFGLIESGLAIELKPEQKQ